jgi:hypothetical protein
VVLPATLTALMAIAAQIRFSGLIGAYASAD